MAKGKKEVQEGKTTVMVKTESERLQAVLDFGALFNADLATLQPYEVAVVWQILDKLEDLTKGRTAAARQALFDLADQIGEVVEKGHRTFEVECGRVTKERRMSKAPSEDHVRSLLAKYNIPVTECFSEQKTMVLDQSKLDFLVSSGRLKAEEVDQGKKETFALKVSPSEEFKKALAGIEKAIERVKPPKALKDSK